MTYPSNFTLPSDVLEAVAQGGMDALPELIRIVVNAAMQTERQAYLQAAPYQRTPERQDYANGYKPKTVNTRMGAIQFEIPQVRHGDFYPSALEKGLRSERALTLALAEMYVQGVSTRKVKAITDKMVDKHGKPLLDTSDVFAAIDVAPDESGPGTVHLSGQTLL